ncbi:MAG: hypothetical protein ACP5HS_14695 [Anaerolineae bacterium]
MQRSNQNRQIVAEFFAQGYRVSGTFSGGNRSLSDVIYDPTTDYIIVRDAYLSPITDPAKISTHYPSATLIKASLDFVITLEHEDGLRRDQHYTLGSFSVDLSLTVPSFEIQGRLHLPYRTFDPRAFLSSEAGHFITLFDVTARCTFNPEVQYEGGAALISRERISFLSEREPR